MELQQLLGERAYPLNTIHKKLYTKQMDGYIVEGYQLTLNGLETVPALCARPLTEGPYPVVLFQHSHGGDFSVGKSEMLKSPAYLAEPNVAKALTALGFAVWGIDAWGFEERGGIAESELVKEFLLTGRTLWGMRLFDVIGLIDYLETREDMCLSQLTTIGMSMGGLLSWWLAALDERVKICIDIAAQVDIETLLQQRRLDHHGFYYYVPRLLQYFSTGEIQAKIAPRARLSLVGKQDTMSSKEGVQKLTAHLKRVYAEKGADNAFVAKALTGGHMETQEMRWEWQRFLKEQMTWK